ncbi:MAG: hypothetical protein WCK67_07715 [bacterium]
MAAIGNDDFFKSFLQQRINNNEAENNNKPQATAVKTVNKIQPQYMSSNPIINNKFTPNNNARLNVASMYAKSYVTPQIAQAQSLKSINKIVDPTIREALEKLREVKFLPGDLDYLNSMGVNTVYKSGEEAVKTIIERGIKVEFAPVDSPKAHAQWDCENNRIVINDKYKDTKDPAVILAISEAMFHEAGHAKDNDGISSIQEEIDCLALNTLAFRYHLSKYQKVFDNAQDAAIINDGVALYARLYFDKDPNKQALVNRVLDKYGDLPFTSPNHSIPSNSLLMSGITKAKGLSSIPQE